MMGPRIVFMGTPDYAIPSFNALLEHGYDVVGVFTQPDKPSGRGKKVVFSPVKQLALERGIPVFQPVRIRIDGVEDLQKLSPDLCVTAAFGQILSQQILDIPVMGTINVHASLLPKYRGSSPVNYCLLHGETVTGVTTMLTDRGIDTGDILLQKERVIEPQDTAGTLTEKLAADGAELLIETIGLLLRGECPRRAQNEAEMSYYPMLKKEMGSIDFHSKGQTVLDQIRAFDPWPASFMTLEGEVFKVWGAKIAETGTAYPPGKILSADPKQGLRIAAADSVLLITELQAPGGRRMAAGDYIRGHRITAAFANE